MTPLTGTPFDRFDPEARRAVAESVARTILEDLNGMEEDAVWSRNRVLYVPVREAGRVCVDTRVPRGSEWRSGHGYEYTTIRISHRIRQPDDRGDTITLIRDVRLTGTVESIARRVRRAVLEGVGSLSAIAP